GGALEKSTAQPPTARRRCPARRRCHTPPSHRYVPEPDEQAVDRIHEGRIRLREEESRHAVADQCSCQRLCQGSFIAPAAFRGARWTPTDLRRRSKRGVEESQEEEQSTDAALPRDLDERVVRRGPLEAEAKRLPRCEWRERSLGDVESRHADPGDRTSHHVAHPPPQ